LLSQNIADLLISRGDGLADARAYAERALAIKRTLDPAASEIWRTYTTLAQIADKEGDIDAALGYRREARTTYAAASVGQEIVRRYGALIIGVVAAVADLSKRPSLEQTMVGMVERGWTKLVEALRRILGGERDEEALCEPLDGEDSLIVGAVLRGLADPESLKTLPSAEPATEGDHSDDLAQRLQKHLPLIAAVIAASGEPEMRLQLDPVLQEMEEHGWKKLVASIRRILNGERSANVLLGGLDEEDTLIIRTILTGIENPSDPDSAGNSAP
jgi:hypothetical protein